MSSNPWISIQNEAPEEGVPVMTKVDGATGTSKEQRLVLYFGVWYLEDMSMPVEHKPTHWKKLRRVYA